MNNAHQTYRHLLADYLVFTVKTFNVHWHIHGHNFFSLHEATEKLYKECLELTDTLAERLRALKEHALFNLKEALSLTQLQEAKSSILPADDGIAELLDDLNKMIARQKEVIGVAEKNSDAGTADMVTEHMELLQKWTWMFASYLNTSSMTTT